MPLKLTCTFCSAEIPEGEDYVDILLNIKEWNGEDTDVDAKEQENGEFCEDCVEKDNMSKFLLERINKRSPNPTRKN